MVGKYAISRESDLVMSQHVCPSKGCNKGVTEVHSHTWLPGYKHIRTCLLAGFITEYPQHYYHNPEGGARGIMVIVLRVFMINP